MPTSFLLASASLAIGLALCPAARAETLVVRGELVHTLAGASIKEGVVVVTDGRIAAVGAAATTTVPPGARELRARVVTPGLVDARTTVGLSGILNQPHDQDVLDKGAPVQPDLRALDAFNAREELVGYVRSLGITTVNTGPAPGALVPGQTGIFKLHGRSADEDVLQPGAMIAVTLGKEGTTEEKGKTPGSRAKSVAVLRAELIKAQEYARKREAKDETKRPARDLRSEAFLRALEGRQPLLVTAQRAPDILAALRIADEFKLKVILNGCADAPIVLEQIKASGFPVILHPTMYRAYDDAENLSMETAAKLKAAGVLFAIQSGYEAYVPKTRVVLFEAAEAAAHGLAYDAALASITIDAAKILGIADRVGSLEPGKDADLALYDGDPFEYTTRCLGTLIDGREYPGEHDF
ncbi:MAG TPA: amidohydrolase family protein [Opitutaceae bacterium]